MKVTDTSLIIANRLSGIVNVFPIVADDVEGDVVVYKRTNSSPNTHKGGTCYHNADIEVVAVSASYKGSILLANKVIDKIVGEGEGYEIELNNTYESFGEERYIQTMIFNIKYK